MWQALKIYVNSFFEEYILYRIPDIEVDVFSVFSQMLRWQLIFKINRKI